MDGGLGHRRVSFAPGPPLSQISCDPFADLARRAERLDRAWLMALSPMLVLPPQGGLGSCRALTEAAVRLDLRPRFVTLDERGPVDTPGVRLVDILDLDPSDAAAALPGLLDWASAVPPASLWTPWRGHDRARFDLADRLADALPKAPVVFEYVDREYAAPLPAEARAFVLEGEASPPPTLFLVMD